VSSRASNSDRNGICCPAALREQKHTNVRRARAVATFFIAQSQAFAAVPFGGSQCYGKGAEPAVSNARGLRLCSLGYASTWSCATSASGFYQPVKADSRYFQPANLALFWVRPDD